jgi:hypothetical protein
MSFRATSMAVMSRGIPSRRHPLLNKEGRGEVDRR